jgi:ABC-type transport system involved in multi-copper enzyme maturation permease subunit
MTRAIAIARRELADKRFVIIAAVAFTVVGLLVPFAPGVRADQRTGALVMASSILATGFTLGLAAILGASIIGRELSDGRLSFYFAKPVPAPAIWFGKLIGAWILILLSFAIIATPALIAGIPAGWDRDPQTVIGVVLSVAVTLFFMSHTVGTMVRSRSAWIGIDFALLVISIAITTWLARLLAEGQAMHLLAVALRVFEGALVVAAIAAGAWQLTEGRIDRRRSHFELSRVLWSAIAVILAVFGLFVGWVVLASPSDIIANSRNVQDRNGPWAFVAGLARGRGDYQSAFLYDTRNGAYSRISATGDFTFSRDGSTAAWTKIVLKRFSLCVRRLPDGPVIDTGINTNAAYVELSDDGSRAAIMGGNLSVYDIAHDRLLGSVHVWSPDDRIERFFFTSPNTIRMYRRKHEVLANEPIRIVEYDVAKKSLTETGSFSAGQARLYTMNSDGSRLIVFGAGEPFVLRDARTGMQIAALQMGSGEPRWASFLHDGRIAATEVAENHAGLRIFAADGTPQMEIPIGNFAVAQVVGEASGDRVIVRVAHERPAKRWLNAVIDLDRKVTERVAADIYLFDSAVIDPDPRAATLPHDVFLVSTASRPMIWDPRSGEKHPLR